VLDNSYKKHMLLITQLN